MRRTNKKRNKTTKNSTNLAKPGRTRLSPHPRHSSRKQHYVARRRSHQPNRSSIHKTLQLHAHVFHFFPPCVLIKELTFTLARSYGWALQHARDKRSSAIPKRRGVLQQKSSFFANFTSSINERRTTWTMLPSPRRHTTTTHPPLD